MTYEQRAIDLARQLDATDTRYITAAMGEQMDAIGELAGGLSLHGYQSDLENWCERKAQAAIDRLDGIEDVSPVYEAVYIDAIIEWFDAATAIMAQTSQQVAA
jgi:hypothetical protein